ncbi:EAL domain-containing protein [uncultured Paraglaciecola sp.]|uniref:putative bifunctional diguanylate cyclase/phosphodiesterase n=1 Tax=uncultured Paraglaciecola sp. TaxID=1765024 RepID=UPI00261402B5|nr:EAL domain-containing protein [uncultured Paraglaciecola sp.]
MPGSPLHKDIQNKNHSKIRLTILMLLLIGGAAIGFTTLIIQVQSGTAGYLGAVGIWSRGQLDTVRQGDIYARTGDPTALTLARKHYQIPLQHLKARVILESDDIDYDSVRHHFAKGGNHPDDIPRMVWLFRFFEDTPYFRDALQAWRNSDIDVLTLGDTLNQLETVWQNQPVDVVKIQQLRRQLDNTNNRLDALQINFRNKMIFASRIMTTILSFSTVIFFLLLSGIATYVVYRLTAAIRISESKFRSTFEKAAMGIAQLDSQGHILDANLAFCEILNYPHHDLLKLQFEQIIHEEDRDISKMQRQALDQKDYDSVSFKQRLHTSDNSLVWAKTTMSRFDWQHPSAQRYICILEDVSEHHYLTEELSYQARHDNLTGLINRRAFEGYLADALLKARSENRMHCLCFIDLDQFKVINDTLGHFAGDQLLLQVTQLFTRHLRKSDLLARLGGDEFGLILDCCEPDEAMKLVDVLRKNLTEFPFVWNGRGFNIGCSIGVVPIMAASSDEAELLQAADSACHMAKEQGRNRVVLTYQDDKELLARREQMEWIERIKHAVEHDKLYLDAQLIDSLNETIKPRIEVLVRMLGEHNEIISPAAFLPAAERFGLAHLVDRWVIEKVCDHLMKHSQASNQFDAYHINISGRSFDHDDFTDFTLRTIKRYKIPAHKLCFEITETAAINNLAVVQTFMTQLREIGCTFALDDFGAGFSSFAYLKQLSVEYLKIDGAFVKNMASDDTDRAMVRAITDIGHTLGKIMVAEFVEDQQTVEWLQKMGIELAQGYHLHRPQRLEDVVKKTSIESPIAPS